jgi:hypothetical protein
MGTPNYQGTNQPPADRGGSWLGSVGSYFGGVPPMYASAPTKATEASKTVQVVAKETSAQPCASAFEPAWPIDPAAIAAGQIAIVIPRTLMSAIDPEALAAGQIAIVVPRNLACAESAQVLITE